MRYVLASLILIVSKITVIKDGSNALAGKAFDTNLLNDFVLI